MDCSHERPADRPAPAPVDALPIGDRVDSELPMRDREKLGALLTRLEPRMAALALRYTRNPDSARDVVQNAFEKVLRHGGKFRGHARVSTWIHRIVANEALMWLRSERRRRDGREASNADDWPQAVATTATPFDSLALRRQLERLRVGLRALSREERDIVRSCAFGGLSYGEFAARAGVHPAAVKSRAFRARRRLAAILDQ